MSIITAVAISYIFNATLILPEIYENFMFEGNGKVKFSKIFDTTEFLIGLDDVVSIAKRPPEGFNKHKKLYPCKKMRDCPSRFGPIDNSLNNIYLRLRDFVGDDQYIQFTVPFRLWKPANKEEWGLCFRVHDALTFNDDIIDEADMVMQALPDDFIAIHMRSESFFEITGKLSASSMQVSQWIYEHIPSSTKLYILSGELTNDVVGPFQETHSVYTWKNFTTDARPSQIQAAVDYLISLESKAFITNSIHSTFDVFVMWDRKLRKNKLTCQLYGKGKLPAEGPVTALANGLDFCPDVIGNIFGPDAAQMKKMK